MGALEAKARKKTQRANLRYAILATIASVGVLGIGLLAPNALKYLKHLGFDLKRRQKESIAASRDLLIRKGFISYRDGSLELTPAGEERLRRFELKGQVAKRPKRWDGKWRVLIFDIPERQKSSRDRIRHTLLSLGFVRLQDSVWLYPYDCEDFVTLLKADFRIGKDLLYLVVDVLEADAPYRRKFGLS